MIGSFQEFTCAGIPMVQVRTSRLQRLTSSVINAGEHSKYDIVWTTATIMLDSRVHTNYAFEMTTITSSE
jgi:hypothetical protein